MYYQNIVTEVCIIELSKFWKLSSPQNVKQGYNWRQKELEVGKGPNFKPAMYDVASFVEEDIYTRDMEFCLLSYRRLNEKIKYGINVFSSLKAQPKEGS